MRQYARRYGLYRRYDRFACTHALRRVLQLIIIERIVQLRDTHAGQTVGKGQMSVDIWRKRLADAIEGRERQDEFLNEIIRRIEAGHVPLPD